MSVLSLYLATPVFSREQLYVAFSHVRSSNVVNVFVQENVNEVHVEDSKIVSTTNVVHKEVLQLSTT